MLRPDPLALASVLLLLALTLTLAVPVRAQADRGTPAASFVRADGTLDLSTAPAGALDLSGLTVTMGADGELHAREGGTYTNISTGPSGPPLDGSVSAVVVAGDGTLYVGGGFTEAGGVTLNHVARRAPGATAWSALGSTPSNTGTSGPVFALALAADGSLYAGGDFVVAGNVVVNYIARWDGAAWDAVAGGLNGPVYALEVAPGGVLYIGGAFTVSGGTSRGIARWNGTSLIGLGTGVGAGSTVLDLTVAGDGSLYAGGDFTTIGGVSASRVARWNGTAWNALGLGVNGGNVYALEAAPGGVLYVGGDFTTAGGATATRIARWSGTAWSALSGGVNDIVRDLVLAGDGSLYVGGGFTTAGAVSADHVVRWSGTAWSALGTGTDGSVLELALAGDGSLYVGGAFSAAGGVATRAVARWSNPTWSTFGSEANGLVRALVIAGDGTVYAGGDFTTIGGVVANHVARWDGTAWHPLSFGLIGQTGIAADRVYALALAPDGTLYAGGSFTSTVVMGASRVAQWNGTAWSALGTGVGSAPPDRVLALAVGPDGTLYAGGDFAVAGGIPASFVARWNGTGWSALGTGMSHEVYALAVGPDGTLYAGGNFDFAGGVGVSRVARWNGTAWSALGGGLGGDVFALAVAPNGTLYAGGDFSGFGAEPNRVARWDGTAWNALGFGTDNAVRSMAFAGDGTLYVGGDFMTAGTPAGNVTVNSIASWNGTAWSPLGTGTSGTPYALDVSASGQLFLGGSFSTVGPVHSPYVALYTPPTVDVEPETESGAALGLLVAPNPVAGGGTIRVRVPAAGRVRVALYDALGREVAVLLDGERAAGEHELALDAGRLAPGVYAVRAEAGGATVVRRVTVAR